MNPRLLFALVLLGLLALRAPSLGLGFAFDDFSQQAILEGVGEHPTLGPFSLYDFGEFDELSEEQANLGGLPFWVEDGLRIRFFRPLTSVSLWLDHKLFGNWAPGYHGVNLAFFALILALAHRLYRQLGLGPGSALLGLAVFALEDGSHSVVVGWIANRNSLIEAFLLLSGLVIATGGEGARSGVRLTVAMLIVWGGVLAKESGVGGLLALGGLLWMAPTTGLAATARPLRLRFAALCAGLALAHPLVLFAAGYGSNSIFYPMPWSAPGAFFSGLLLHLSVGVATAFGPLSADVAFMQPGLRPWLIGCALLLLASIAGPMLRTARERPEVSFLALLAVATFLPQLVAPPSDRLIFVPLLGLGPWIGLTLERLWSVGTVGRSARTVRVGAIVLGFFVLPLSAFASIAQQSGFARIAAFTREAIQSPDIGTVDDGERDIVILQTPVALMALNPGPTRWGVTGDFTKRFWTMQAGRRPLRWTRTGPKSFELESLGEPFFTSPLESVFRTRSATPPAGTRYRSGTLEVEVLDPGRRLAVTLDRPLENERLRFLYWSGEGWEHLDPPALGESREVIAGSPPLPLVP